MKFNFELILYWLYVNKEWMNADKSFKHQRKGAKCSSLETNHWMSRWALITQLNHKYYTQWYILYMNEVELRNKKNQIWMCNADRKYCHNKVNKIRGPGLILYREIGQMLNWLSVIISILNLMLHPHLTYPWRTITCWIISVEWFFIVVISSQDILQFIFKMIIFIIRTISRSFLACWSGTRFWGNLWRQLLPLSWFRRGSHLSGGLDGIPEALISIGISFGWVLRRVLKKGW